jgi:hypothetical protein
MMWALVPPYLVTQVAMINQQILLQTLVLATGQVT